MVEESNSNKTKKSAATPRPVYSWTVATVQKWFLSHFSDYNTLYGGLFQKHDITGKVLVRMNETKLLRLGIIDPKHRQEIWREILKLKLKHDAMEIRGMQIKQEIRDMQRKQIYD